MESYDEYGAMIAPMALESTFKLTVFKFSSISPPFIPFKRLTRPLFHPLSPPISPLPAAVCCSFLSRLTAAICFLVSAISDSYCLTSESSSWPWARQF